MTLGLLIVLLLAVDVVLPIPSSVISIAAAVMFGVLIGSLLIFIGMTLCCLFGYYLGRQGHSLVRVYSENDKQQSVKKWVQRWGAWSLLVSRPLPVMAETSIVMAGMTRFPIKRFLVYTIPANAVIAILYGGLVYLGNVI